ncbi:MAG: xanthine dehydrogenase family protein subunit M [Rhodobacterales bacterium]|nr:xanthine dehydrogenase family protein subunit M [Rhodobacterales bacterium]
MQYIRPRTAAEVSHLLMTGDGGARIMAGGTDLLVQLRSGMIAPKAIVDIKGLDGIACITPEDGGWRIGAAVSGQRLGEHEHVRAIWPGVVEACELIGSTQVQGRCTMAGNLCNGSPAADSVPALIAAGAVARIEGPDGAHDCAVEDIPEGPGKTSLRKGEFLSSVFLPGRPAGAADAYLRFIPRTEMDIAVASAAVNIELARDGTIRLARIALGAVGPKVVLVQDAANAIIGSKLEDPALKALARACEAACNPIDDKRGTAEFRTTVAGVLARRAARIAMTRAKERAGENP